MHSVKKLARDGHTTWAIQPAVQVLIGRQHQRHRLRTKVPSARSKRNVKKSSAEAARGSSSQAPQAHTMRNPEAVVINSTDVIFKYNSTCTSRTGEVLSVQYIQCRSVCRLLCVDDADRFT
jgi:activator of HSP90 ATPase